MHVIGHITIDHVELPNASYVDLGGPPIHCSTMLIHINAPVKPISVVGRDALGMLNPLRGLGIDLSLVKVDECRTTRFRLRYSADYSRELWLMARCRDFKAEDISADLDVAVINPVAGEFPIGLMPLVKSRSRLVAVDLQGFVRGFRGDGYVYVKADEAPLSAIAEYADLIKVSLDEAPRRLPRAKLTLVSQGGRLARLIRGPRTYYFDEAPSVRVVNPTGAGDVLTCAMAHYLRLGLGEVDSFIRAVALSMVKTTILRPLDKPDLTLLDRLTETLSRLIRSVG